MRKLFFVPALLVLTLVGCNKIIDAPVDNAESPEKITEKETEGVPVTFSTQTQGSETKVTLDGLQLKWAASDQIAVYSYKGEVVDPTAKDLCTLSSEPGSATGSFRPITYTYSSQWVTEGSDEDVYTFYSWYPATSAPTATSEALSQVATTQHVSVGVGSYLICWATGNATKTRAEVVAGDVPHFSYTPKVSIVNVSLQNTTGSDITIKKIIVTSSSGNIAGNVSLNVKTGAISGGTSDKVELILNGEDGVVIANGVTAGPYAVAVLPTDGTLYFNAIDGAGNTVALGKSVSAPKPGRLYSRTPEIFPIARNEEMEYVSSNADETGYYYGVANCVVMPSGTTTATLDISLFKEGANYSRGDLATNRRSAITSAKLIWHEEGLVLTPTLSWMGNECTLNITASPNTGGNALIGVYNADDELLWSFHVWAPNSKVYNANTSSISTITSYTAINMALGQVTGLNDTYMYYQWGRKDPLGRASALCANTLFEMTADQGDTAPSVSNSSGYPGTSVSLATARTNPWFFYNVYGKSWKTPTADEDPLWNTVSTIYDPCPKGYHVPPVDLWRNPNLYGYPDDPTLPHAGQDDAYITSLQENLYVDLSGLRYVLAGSRNHSYGTVANSYPAGDYMGNYWCTDRTGGSGLSLFLKFSAGANPGNGAARSNGLGVRCVKDSAIGLNPGFNQPFVEQTWK